MHFDLLADTFLVHRKVMHRAACLHGLTFCGTTADIGRLIGLPLGPCCTFTVIVIFLVPVPFDAACVAASDVV